MTKPTLIFIALIAVFMMGFFLLWPKYQDFRNLRLQLKEKQVEYQNKEKYFSDLEATAKELVKYNEELSKIDFILPSQVSLPSLFDFFQRATSQNGLILENLGTPSVTSSAENTEGEAALKKIKFSLGVSGSYSSLKTFLSTLEKTSKLIEVESVSLTPPKEITAPFSFNLELKTYSY